MKDMFQPETIESALSPTEVMERFEQKVRQTTILKQTPPEEWYADTFVCGERIDERSFVISMHERTRVTDNTLFNIPLKITVTVSPNPQSGKSTLTLQGKWLPAGKILPFISGLCWLLTALIAYEGIKTPVLLLVATFTAIPAALTAYQRFRPTNSTYYRLLKEELMKMIADTPR